MIAKVLAFARASVRTGIVTGGHANKLDDVEADIEKESSWCRVLALSCDMKDEKSVNDLFAALLSQVIHVDVLVNTGSSVGRGRIADSDPSLWWVNYVSSESS